MARNFANPDLVPILLDLVESGKGAVVLEALKALQYQEATVSGLEYLHSYQQLSEFPFF